MLSRAAKPLLTTVATVASGVGIDRMAHGKPEPSGPPPLPQRPAYPVPKSGTGNERLGRFSESVRSGIGDSPVTGGISAQFAKMQELGADVATLAQHPVISAEQFKELADGLKNDALATVGAAKVVGGQAPLTKGDVGRLGKAAAQDAIDHFDPAKPFETARKVGDAVYAASTTSKDGIDEVASAMRERLEFEAKAGLAGAAIMQVGATAISMMPFPGAPLVGAAVRTVGTMASAAHMSATMREIGGEGEGGDSALRKTAAEILIEKSGQ
ncbi:hypothetical protein [Pseudoduganella violaceinigra]|uniref:hypothetical protein n=1 Tax=Pseudoduganella violaceinigra TaxID=246602 RepID=UPI00041AE39A|nr:hypothetical protein [Pseudoduganella violaceinigra]